MKVFQTSLPVSFDIDRIFDCGQCFRFDRSPAPEGHVRYEGVAFGRKVTFDQSPGVLTVYGSDENDFETVWKPFLCYDADYNAIRNDIAERFRLAGDNGVITEAMKCGDGIRILRQDAWEALCSFIISQNNNIPRIKKIIGTMCETFGAPAEGGGYSFPSAEALAAAGEDRIFALRTGFRAKYIFDASCKVASGELNPYSLCEMSFEEAEKALMTIKGVGPKVAACTLLFGCGMTGAFPVDVWIKRVLEKYYPGGLDISLLGPYAGIAQQYLFYYERYAGGEKKKTS